MAECVSLLQGHLRESLCCFVSIVWNSIFGSVLCCEILLLRTSSCTRIVFLRSMSLPRPRKGHHIDFFSSFRHQSERAKCEPVFGISCKEVKGNGASVASRLLARSGPLISHSLDVHVRLTFEH